MQYFTLTLPIPGPKGYVKMQCWQNSVRRIWLPCAARKKWVPIWAVAPEPEQVCREEEEAKDMGEGLRKICHEEEEAKDVGEKPRKAVKD